jgi:hypothetical protein
VCVLGLLGLTLSYNWQPFPEFASRFTDATPTKPGAVPPAAPMQPVWTPASPPNSRDQRLAEMKSRIEAGALSLSTIISEGRQMKVDHQTLGRQIDGYRAELDRFEAEINAGREVDEAAYRRVLFQHNQLVPVYNEGGAALDRQYAAYNTSLQEQNRLIGEYNAMVSK